MRFAGRMQDWDDDKGFGFVSPTGGGSRAFVHIRAFQRGSRRPVNGDLVSYAVVRDARGRSNAIDVRHAGQRIAQPRDRRALKVPRTLVGISVLLLVGAAAWLALVPVALALVYWLASGISYLLYSGDKAAAGRAGVGRTPEKTLHLIDLLGGWPGALIAQQRYRHKTAKMSFQAAFVVTVVANLALVAWLARSGLLEAIGSGLPR